MHLNAGCKKKDPFLNSHLTHGGKRSASFSWEKRCCNREKGISCIFLSACALIQGQTDREKDSKELLSVGSSIRGRIKSIFSGIKTYPKENWIPGLLGAFKLHLIDSCSRPHEHSTLLQSYRLSPFSLNLTPLTHACQVSLCSSNVKSPEAKFHLSLMIWLPATTIWQVNDVCHSSLTLWFSSLIAETSFPRQMLPPGPKHRKRDVRVTTSVYG